MNTSKKLTLTTRNARRAALLTVSLVAMVSASTNFAAEAVSVEDRLSALEKSLTAVQKENTDLKKQLGWDGKTPLVVVKPNGKENKLKVGGYIQGHFETGDSPDARFVGIEDRAFLRRARLGVSGSFQEQFDFKLEADFGANSLSEQTGYRAGITDAFVNWNRYSFANVKFGQFKTPFGYEQLQADTKILTVERSLPNDRLTDSRQIGLGVAGDIVSNRLSYSVGAFNGSGVNNSFNDNDNFMWAGRVSGVVFDGKIADRDARVAIGINGLSTRDTGISKTGFGFDAVAGGAVDNLFTGQRQAWGIDAQAKWGLFGLEGEYLCSEFKPTNPAPSARLTADGWSAAAIVEVLPKRLQAFVKFESFDPNRSVNADTTDVWTLGLNYLVKGDDLKLSLNYLLGNAPGAPEHSQGRVLARVQVIF
jgi:phosphate-selective porin